MNLITKSKCRADSAPKTIQFKMSQNEHVWVENGLCVELELRAEFTCNHFLPITAVLIVDNVVKQPLICCHGELQRRNTSASRLLLHRMGGGGRSHSQRSGKFG